MPIQNATSSILQYILRIQVPVPRILGPVGLMGEAVYARTLPKMHAKSFVKTAITLLRAIVDPLA